MVPEVAPRSRPLVSEEELVSHLARVLDSTQTFWEFDWLPADGKSLQGQVRRITLRALSQARSGGLYYEGSSWSWTTRSDEPGQKVTVTVKYRLGDLSTKVAEVNRKVDAVVATTVKPGMSDYEKELALHDWLVAHSTYDLANFEANTVPPAEYTPYGVLVLGTGVCESYSSAFQLLADKAGLESHIVTGTGNGNSHAWNQVKVEGVWYNLDVTWDDPGDHRVDHDYFNVNDQTLGTEHQWDRGSSQPCTSEQANWFVRQGLVVPDMKALASKARKTIEQRGSGVLVRIENHHPKTFPSDVDQTLTSVASAEQVSLGWTTDLNPALGVVEVHFEYHE